jgi:hypothetical protein
MAKKAPSTPVKKVAAKKVAAPVKKVAAPKVAPAPAPAPVKKVAAKKAPAAKKATVKKAAAPKAKAVTTIIAKVDIGFGNLLYLRGEGAGLSWDQGIPLDCVNSDEWTWKTSEAPASGLVFKLLINDEIWSQGEDLTVEAGGTSISAPAF